MVQCLLSAGFVSEEPVFKLTAIGNMFTCETVSLVPANYTWMSCSSSNDRYEYSQGCSISEGLVTLMYRHTKIQTLSHCSSETDSSCKEIPGAFHSDSDIFCNKSIKSSLSKDPANETLKFCLTNSVGSWCETMSYPLSPQASKGNKLSFTPQYH